GLGFVRGRHRRRPVSRAIHPLPLPRSTTPAEPTIPRLFDGSVDAAPALPTARASALNEFRGSITRLWHLLPMLQDWCCHHPCKARFRLAGSPLPGGSRTLRIATKGFRSIAVSSSFSGFILAQGKFHSEPPTCFTSLTSSARASSVGGTSRPSAFAVLRLMIRSNLVGCLLISRKGKRLGVAYAGTPRGEGGAASLKFKTK